MKRLRFYTELKNLMLAGEKTKTWRLFDDKDLQEGDMLECVETQTDEVFGHARIVHIKETTLGNLTEEDWEGHERFSSDEEMYQNYAGYYNTQVDASTPVKIISFTFNKKEI